MNTSLTNLLSPVLKFLEKYSSTLFFTVVVLLLAGAILSLFLTSTQPQSQNQEVKTIGSSFDQKTANAINELRDSGEPAKDLSFPKPRSNPFIE